MNEYNKMIPCAYCGREYKKSEYPSPIYACCNECYKSTGRKDALASNLKHIVKWLWRIEKIYFERNVFDEKWKALIPTILFFSTVVNGKKAMSFKLSFWKWWFKMNVFLKEKAT